VSQRKIAGPLVFEEPSNTEWYQNLLAQFLSLLEENERDFWFQHGGAMAHTVNTTALLQELSGECTVGHGLWPPQSPDFTPSDIFLWGFFRHTLHKVAQNTLEILL
jgi:hypothetical protein